ncbi:unknown [Azospirillum sp. CAG:239]|nr:unknown [Azospirillum sp. CAG:239]
MTGSINNRTFANRQVGNGNTGAVRNINVCIFAEDNRPFTISIANTVKLSVRRAVHRNIAVGNAQRFVCTKFQTRGSISAVGDIDIGTVYCSINCNINRTFNIDRTARFSRDVKLRFGMVSVARRNFVIAFESYGFVGRNCQI